MVVGIYKMHTKNRVHNHPDDLIKSEDMETNNILIHEKTLIIW